MYYELTGKGPPIVLIIGLGSGHQMWDAHVPALSRKFAVLTMDNRGVGDSDKPDGEYTTKIMADDTADLMQRLRITQAHVVGASLGGAIAQELAINYSSLVRTLILMCTWAKSDKYLDSVLESWIELAQLGGVPTMNRNGLLWCLTRQYYEKHFGEIKRLDEQYRERDLPVSSLIRQARACQKHDALDRLDRITAPTLIAVGDRDILTPVHFSEVLQQRITKSELHILKGAPHAFFWENPGVFVKIVTDFIENHSSNRRVQHAC
jgi:pimeloyl-ACP methyl ester carboxylesterase